MSCSCRTRRPLGARATPDVSLIEYLGKRYKGNLFDAARLHLILESLTAYAGHQKSMAKSLRISERVMCYQLRELGLRDSAKMLRAQGRA